MADNKTRKSKTRNSVPHKHVLRLPFVQEVEGRLISGASIPSIVTYIKAKGYWKDVSDNAAMQRLVRFNEDLKARASKSGKLVVNDVNAEGAVTPTTGDSTEITPHQISEIQKLSKLVDIQMDRIMMLHKQEKTISFPLNTGRNEIAEARNLLHTLIDKKRDLGFPGYRGFPKERESSGATNIQTVNIIQNENVAAVLENPASRRRILEAIKAVNTGDDSEKERARHRFGLLEDKMRSKDDDIIDV